IGHYGLVQGFVVLPLLVEGDQGVLHILEGSQHGFLVREEGLIMQGLLYTDIRQDAATLEDRPTHRRTQRPRVVGPGEKAVEQIVLIVERAGERELGEEIGCGDPDLRRGSVNLRFGLLDIRSAPQQSRRQSYGDCWRYDGEGLGCR